MKNRAKCKICRKIIESFHQTDLVECECGEIMVDGGPSMRCGAKNWDNFLRVDDNDNDIIVSVKETENPMTKPNKNELIKILENMIENLEKLPSQALVTPINHYDLLSALILLASIFKSDLREV